MNKATKRKIKIKKNKNYYRRQKFMLDDNNEIYWGIK